MTILKVQYKDEIRRITLDNGSLTLSNLTTKVHQMFPLLTDFVLQYRDDDGIIADILTDEELNRGVTSANSKFPPIFRVNVVEGTLENPLPTNTSTTVVAEVSNESSSSEEEEKQETQNQEVEQPAVSDNATGTVCSHCQTDIGAADFSFKCINCFDFLLCKDCESNAEHDTSHLMVKLRVPVQNLSLKQQLIFTRYVMDSEQKKLAAQQKLELLKCIKTKDLETKIKNKEDRIRARKERIRRRIQAKKKLDEKAKRVCSKKCTKKGKNNKKLVAALPIPVTAEPLAQPELEEVVFEAPELEEEITPVENILIFFDDVEDEAGQPKEIDYIGSKEQVESWDLYKSFTDTVTSAVSGVANALSPNAEDHRIQGIAFRQKLDALEGMGFTDRNRNIILLVKNLASLEATVGELLEAN